MNPLTLTAPAPRADVLDLLRATGRGLSAAWCVLNGGHYKVLHTQDQRLCLRCVACGHESPGWQVGKKE